MKKTSRDGKREKLRRAYDFFQERSAADAEFTLKELSDATGWSQGTVRTYPSKQWEGLLDKIGRGRYRVKDGFRRYSFKVFANLNS